MAISAYKKPVFQKAMRIINAITNQVNASVTTSFAHNYITGMIVRLNIPLGYGMQQANQLYGPIVVTGSTTFTIAIDTTFMDPFLYQLNIDTTDSSGNASSGIDGTELLIGLGQTFDIGPQLFKVVSVSGALATDGDGTGTMDLSSGIYSFSGCTPSSSILWTPISFPLSYQLATVTPVGEISDTLKAATVNSLPYSAS
jgi:hypothetical protein